jgi:hypothetical protein
VRQVVVRAGILKKRSRRCAALTLAAPLAFGLACGGRSHSEGAAGAAGSGGAAGGGAGLTGSAGLATAGMAGSRVPDHHRAAGTPPCPSERGSNEPLASASMCPEPVDCQRDAECSDGEQGRCLASRFPCFPACSYDTCSTDDDCPDHEPCSCRDSATALLPNHCLTEGNCRIDADCGTGGYCSPSLLEGLCVCTSVDYCAVVDPTNTCTTTGSCSCGDSCGHDYYCHTPSDECLNDSDCEDGARCGFDLAHRHWICAICGPVP